MQNEGGKGVFITPVFNNVYALMFADDVSALSDTCLQLQKKINALELFCKETGMKVNLKKTKVVVFRNGEPLRSYEKWYFNGEQIETVSFYKYLGIIFTPKLVWSRAQTCLASQARKAILSVNHFQKKFGNINCTDLFKIFDALITPILCYGSEIWGTSYCKSIESVQLEFCKKYLKINRSSCNSMALGECGRLPLQIHYMTRVIKYWCRLLQLPHDRLPFQSYLMLKSLDDNGRTTWVSKVKNLLFSFGFGYVWLSQDIGDVKMFMSLFKQRL